MIEPDGTAHGLGNLPAGLPNTDAVDAARQAGSDLRTQQVAGVPVRIYTEAIQGARTGLAVEVVADITNEVRTVTTLVSILVAGGLLIMAASLALGWFYAGRALVPIRDSLRRQREFAADASHELRTPLAIIRATVDDLRAEPDGSRPAVHLALDDIAEETDHLLDLVGDLLVLRALTRARWRSSGRPSTSRRSRRQAVGNLESLARDRQVELRSSTEPAPMQGDAGRLRQLVTILVDNAIRHSPRGGSVRVAVSRAGTSVLLYVDDQGPGIPPDHRDRVFDRFWRGTSRGASGSGLWARHRRLDRRPARGDDPRHGRGQWRSPLRGSPARPV